MQAWAKVLRNSGGSSGVAPFSWQWNDTKTQSAIRRASRTHLRFSSMSRRLGRVETPNSSPSVNLRPRKASWLSLSSIIVPRGRKARWDALYASNPSSRLTRRMASNAGLSTV